MDNEDFFTFSDFDMLRKNVKKTKKFNKKFTNY